MKTLLLLIFGWLLVSCTGGVEDNTVPVSPYAGTLAIFLEHDFLCEGQSSRIHAVQLDPWLEIPLTEIEFTSLGTGDGIISASGNYTAPENVSEKRIIKFNAKFKNGSKGALSGEIQVFPKGLFPKTGVKTIPSQLGLNRPYAVLSNDDLVFGSSHSMMHASTASNHEIIRVSPLGEVLWRTDLGTFNSRFIQVKSGKIYSAGFGQNDQGPALKKGFILNEAGEILKEFPIDEEGNIFSMLVGNSGIIYFLIRDFEKKTNLILGLDEEGKNLLKKSFDLPIDGIKLNSEGLLIGSGKLGENESSKQVMFSLNKDLENYRLMYEEKLEWPYVSSPFYILPNDQIGLIKSVDKKAQGDTQWIINILNSDGSVFIKNKIIHQSTSGVGGNSEPYLNNIKQRDLDQISHVISTKEGQVYVSGLSYNQSVGFLEIVNLSGENHWYYPLNEAIGLGTYPVSFIEHEGMLIYTIDEGGKVLSFTLDKNLNFDPCAYRPYWSN